MDPRLADPEGNINMVDMTFTNAGLADKIRRLKQDIKELKKETFESLRELIRLRQEVSDALARDRVNQEEVALLWVKLKRSVMRKE
ncbi:hypothetical protein C8T65DRAFT_746112 [Cerioporus squamosus]|nr:hypothetical protein C8T65DRAFT_746112 [Cerioporus squamosus]